MHRTAGNKSTRYWSGVAQIVALLAAIQKNDLRTLLHCEVAARGTAPPIANALPIRHVDQENESVSLKQAVPITAGYRQPLINRIDALLRRVVDGTAAASIGCRPFRDHVIGQPSGQFLRGSDVRQD